MENVFDNVFDVYLLGDPLVKFCISFSSLILFLCLSPPVCEINAYSPMFESCITIFQSLHFADFPLPGNLSTQFEEISPVKHSSEK